MLSSRIHAAWFGKPSSFARSARSATMSAMIGPFVVSPRDTNIFQTFSRSARSFAYVSTGSTLERVFATAHLPLCPFASAIAATTSSGTPASWSLVSTTTVCFSSSASWFWLNVV